MKISRFITAAVATLALGGAGIATAGPALADGPTNVNVNASVASTLTVSGITGSIALAGNPGSTATNANAETYLVTTNNATGYNVTVQPQSNTLSGPGNPIPVSALTAAGVAFPSPAATVTIHNKNTPSAVAGDSITDAWSLAIPAGQAAGAYSASFTYLVSANS